MARSRSRSKERRSGRNSDRDSSRRSSRERRSRRSRSRSADRDRRRDRSRSRDRDTRGRDGDQHRNRSSRARDSRSRSRGRDQGSTRSRSREGRPSSSSAPAAASGGTGRSASADKRARLDAWKARQQQGAAANGTAAASGPGSAATWAPWDDPSLPSSSNVGIKVEAASRDASPPGQRAGLGAGAVAPPAGYGYGAPPPSGLGYSAQPAAAAAAAAAAVDDDVDPLDAFMAAEVLPEVAQKQMAEAKKREEERMKHAEMLASGKTPKLLDILAESDSEEEPDLEIQIPTSRVKLLVGPGGTMIGKIQHKSKARLQIKKEEEELNRAWGSGPSQPVKLPPQVRQQLQKQQAAAARAAKEGRLLQAAQDKEAAKTGLLLQGAKDKEAAEDKEKKGGEDKEKAEGDEGEEDDSGDEAKPGAAPRKMTTVMIFGDQKAIEIAERMIYEAIDNREQKVKQRQKEYDRKREEKRRARLLYHMRHTKDYEALELAPGSSKVEVKKAYRRLAMLWHPDKHPDNAEEAKAKFQVIQKAYDSLMSTDEEEIQAQIAG